jgi:hypothetical protein
MAESSLATVVQRSAVPEPGPAPVACLELDRFCEGCGYNLRTLPVIRERHTGIPVVRCTECGRFQPANNGATALRPWLSRITSVLLVAWILTIVAAFIWLCIGEGALSYATLDELTTYGGQMTQRIVAGTTIRTWTTRGQLTIDSDYPDYRLFISTILVASFASAFVFGMFVVVVCPHWRRGAYVGLVLAVPLAVGGVVATGWSQEAPHLFEWGLRYIMAHAGVQLLGGLMGVNFGRPLARTATRIFLPPSARPRLAYLWLADNKPFPVGDRRAEHP